MNALWGTLAVVAVFDLTALTMMAAVLMDQRDKKGPMFKRKLTDTDKLEEALTVMEAAVTQLRTVPERDRPHLMVQAVANHLETRAEEIRS